MPLGEGKRVKDEHVLPEHKFETKKQKRNHYAGTIRNRNSEQRKRSRPCV